MLYFPTRRRILFFIIYVERNENDEGLSLNEIVKLQWPVINQHTDLKSTWAESSPPKMVNKREETKEKGVFKPEMKIKGVGKKRRPFEVGKNRETSSNS